MKRLHITSLNAGQTGKPLLSALGVFLFAVIFTGMLSARAEAAEENLEKLIKSREKGWAAGKWQFSIKVQENMLGKMEMEIKETKKGYEAEMLTTIEIKKMKYEITGRSGMDRNLQLVWAERVEKGISREGTLALTITAEVKNKILTIAVKNNGKETERTEMEAPSPLYAGTPALFAMLKLVNLRRPMRHTFNLYNAENRRVVKTNLDIVSGRKLIEVGGRKVETYSAVADNGKTKMLFEINPDNEIIRLSVPGEPLAFERIFPEAE